MAVLHLSYFSHQLMRYTNFTAVVPVDHTGMNDEPLETGPFKTLYLLHGASENEYAWLVNSRIGRWAQERGIAVIMPAGDNKFYVDHPRTVDNYARCIGEELVAYTRGIFPLSQRRADTAIAGVSMGGYGAMLLGMRYSETFGSVASLGGGFHFPALYDQTMEDHFPLSQPDFLRAMFGEFRGSENDFRACAKALAESGRPVPRLLMMVGQNDFLREYNEAFARYLRSLGFALAFSEAPGAHNWDFWDAHVLDILDWFEKA